MTDGDGEETGEDVALDDTWNYSDILWNGIQAERCSEAFDKLNYQGQTLLEKRLANLHDLRACRLMENRPPLRELAA